MDRMLTGLSTRRYPVGLEPVGERTERAATSTSKSTVSRRFVAATETALAELLAAARSTLDLMTVMVDGVHFGEHTCVVALGIDIDGTKHPLSLVAGSTENAQKRSRSATGQAPSTVAAKMRRAYHADFALAGEAELTALAAEFDRTHPRRGGQSARGMAETRTVLRLNMAPTLARTFRSTNAIESMISICRTHPNNVKALA